jgi:YggT family protein
MIVVTLLVFFDLFVKLFNILIIGRIIMSWTSIKPETNVFARILFEVTEPVLAPVRKLIHSSGSFDLAPLVTVMLLWGLHALIFGA